ncbi:hypothetical protein NLJ89_g7159 [Agrocybe chaxingu]|uniref:Tafazzin family protein n=1 Tax=Agrocybe chaxingu TaxID=84603 RepID=A0A9W8K503_9AGAR|nr:hypothetical protein NLJ89_g7159 [Agrocybe chaxingu]
MGGRILMEASVPPVVIPMWITGFEQLMPEGRPFPYKYLPRIGVRLSVTFGEPVLADELRAALAVSKSDADVDASAAANQPGNLSGWLGKEGQRRYDTGAAASDDDHVYAALIRQKVTAIIHRDVQALGRSVSGKLLTGFKSDS